MKTVYVETHVESLQFGYLKKDGFVQLEATVKTVICIETDIDVENMQLGYWDLEAEEFVPLVIQGCGVLYKQVDLSDRTAQVKFLAVHPTMWPSSDVKPTAAFVEVV